MSHLTPLGLVFGLQSTVALVAQGDQRIDPRGAAGRDERAEECDSRRGDSSDDDAGWIVRGDLEEQRLQESPQQES